MRNRLFYFIVILFCCQLSFAQVPRVFLLNPEHVRAKKDSYKNGNKEVGKTVEMVIRKADAILPVKPKSVMDKGSVPPSGSKHDYMSLAPYFWPDPAKPDGTPYIRKDGERNPEIKKITDAVNLSELNSKCKFLALAWYFTGKEEYAAKASQLLDTWFINADTKMNPNLNYAQAILGVNDGRGIGIIESRWLAELGDWMGLLEGSKAFTKDQDIKIKDWYKQYLIWLLNSKNGKDEHHAKNNHGTIYDSQVAAYALFTGQNELAETILKGSLERINVQIEPDGRQPLELERTRAYSYSTMNLTDGWFNLALLGQNAGVDIWNYKTTDGRSIRKALDWLIPYALDEKPKDLKQIIPYEKTDLYKLLILAGTTYKDNMYLKKAASIPTDNETKLIDLLYN